MVTWVGALKADRLDSTSGSGGTTLGKCLNLGKPQVTHLHNECDKSTYTIYVKSLAWC